MFKVVIRRIIKRMIYFYYWFRYKNPPKPDKVLWVNTADIYYFTKGYEEREYLLMKRNFGSLILDTNLWDSKIDAEEEIANSEKYQAIRERFVDGIPWSESQLLRNRFEDRKKNSGGIKGFDTFEELAAYYTEYYDSLYENIKEKGMLPSLKNNDISPIYIDIDRDGNICYTLDGNHRLAMALILGIEEIPVRIRAIHKEWQLKRDELWKIGPDSFFEKYPELKDHRDLDDCIRIVS